MRRRFTILGPLVKFAIFIAMEVACLVMVTNSGIIQGYAVMGALRNLQASISEKTIAIKEYFGLREINDNLWEENVKLFGNLLQLRRFINDSIANALLEGMEYAGNGKNALKGDFEYLPARVVKRSIGVGRHNYFIINKGKEDGVEENMGVVTPFGVVGIVRAASASNSYVLSFLNPKQQVSAMLLSKEAFGPLRWMGEDLTKAMLSDIPQHIEVNVGDTVCTSGLSSIYPAGIPLGRVTGSRVLNGIHNSIEVELFQSADNVQYVIVAKNYWRKELDSLSRIAEEEKK